MEVPATRRHRDHTAGVSGSRPATGRSQTYDLGVPVYEYRCRECDTTFEQRRAIADADGADVRCPDGHARVTRLLSVFASGGRASAPASGGGCCGGACGCG